MEAVDVVWVGAGTKLRPLCDVYSGAAIGVAPAFFLPVLSSLLLAGPSDWLPLFPQDRDLGVKFLWCRLLICL